MEENAAKVQAEEQLKVVEAQLADLKLGKRKAEIGVVTAQLIQARAAKEQAAQQLKRDEAQFKAGGISRVQLEDSRANYAIKTARVREFTGLLEVSRLPARDDQIRAQNVQVAAAQAATSQLNWRFDQKHLAASEAGLVADTMYREGEWVSAGSPVVRLLPPKNMKVRFFVPEVIPGGIKHGRNVTLHCDGCGADVPATVTYISNDPEYTPRLSTVTRTARRWCSWLRRTPRSRMRFGCGLVSRLQ